MHLFFLINGLYGSSKHMTSVAEALESGSAGNSTVVVSATSVQGFQTFDGVELCALRLYQELLSLLERHSVTKVSLVGYSMGGLYARYLAGLLYRNGILELVEPCNFVTFATPHLGTTLWKPGLETRLLNGAGRVLLGPSGFDLMSRGPHGVLDRMSDPQSEFYKALQRFPNLVLVANAVGDRSVKFWTAYMTNVHAFPHRDRQYYQHTLYKHGKHGSYLVDMQQPIQKLPRIPPPEMEKKETVISFNLFYALIPVLATVLLCVSIYRWALLAVLKPFYRVKCWISTRRFLRREKVPATVQGDQPSTVGDRLHGAMEGSSKPAASHAYELNTEPKPVVENKSALIDECPNLLPLNRAVLARMENMNRLPWKKYVAYLNHIRTHAFIIDRMREGESVATDLLQYFASILEH